MGNLQSHFRGCRVLEIILVASGEERRRGIKEGEKREVARKGKKRLLRRRNVAEGKEGKEEVKKDRTTERNVG